MFFLLFAEFALLHLMEAAAPDPASLRVGLALLGGGGVLGSVLAARFSSGSIRADLALGFAGCATAATLAAAPVAIPLGLVASITGAGLGWLTVQLAGNLHRLLPPRHLGIATGVGTGVAYAFCNLPWVFASSPVGHAWIGAAACGVGALAALLLKPREPDTISPPTKTGRDVFWWLLGALVLLVWLDSAAFLLIQERAELRALAWATAGQLWANAAVHLSAALLAGWLLDRGKLRFALLLAGASLLVASFALARGGPPAARLHLLYPAGVSLYSTALVALPALGRGWTGGERTRRRAAWLYVLAGWIGSALGIGMAMDQRTIPLAFLAVAGGGLAATLLLSRRGIATLAMLALLTLWPDHAAAGDQSEAAPIEQGRQVYIAEGCIHCHSQFVRPGTADELQGGPSRPLAEMLKEAPPLPGNRRQGPDLQNVGNRRSPDWNRIHLRNPRALAPGSTMPRYDHLFRDGESRGEALLAYLQSLGADTTVARAEQVAGWQPTDLDEGDAARGKKLFAALYTSCHGTAARGRGALAAHLAITPADLAAGPLPRTTRASAEETRDELARVIRFGIPGTAMAGHETLPERDIAALTAYVSALKLPPPPK